MKYLISLLFLLIPLSVFWATNEQISRLETYDKKIEELRLQKSELETSWEDFRNTYGWITEFISKNLSANDREELNTIVTHYLALSRETSQNIETRNTFLKSLEKFIDEDKKSNFEKYRTVSMSIESERLELNTLIKNTEQLKQERTDILRTHIADNALERRQLIKERIEVLLRQRLDSFISNENFIKLPNDRKILVFWRILWRIQMQQSELEASGIKTTVQLDRIETYKAIEAIMLEYINSWR